MEALIQHFYLNLLNKFFVFIVCTFLILSTYILFFLNFKKINEIDNLINIPKGSSINNTVDIILYEDHYLNKELYLIYLKLFYKFYDKVKFGEFKIDKDLNLIQITNIISKPSNYYRSFSIIGSWQAYQLENLIYERFNLKYPIKYNEIIADTFNYKLNDQFEEIYKLMKVTKDKFFNNHKGNELFNEYTINEIMIIGSLVEKEGKTEEDKRLISSVIFNRLSKNLKLQIDATTIFSITKGRHKLERKLTYKDLKIKDKFNTYFIYGLPPEPICYVNRKTIEIVLENYKSSYLFYFYDTNMEKHVFSKTYKIHKKLLNKYRNSE